MTTQRLTTLLGLTAVAGVAVACDWWFAYPSDYRAHYVGRAACSDCHQAEASAWSGSHHDLAMDLASEDTVLGDFDNREFTRLGVTTKFFRRDGKFMVHTEGPDGAYDDFEIKYTFGVDPLQQYMIEFPDGRVQVLRVSWDTRAERWFYVYPPDVVDERIAPDDPLHWTGVAQNWNTTCADCHSTNLEKNYDLATNTYHTTFSEIDVSCEACHGPASLHIELAESRSLFWDRHHGYGLARLKGSKSDVEIETCAPCHSRRNTVHANFRPGEELLDYFDPARISAGLYHDDGQILDEVYVYGSFLQSKMHAEGVRCSDCHQPHSLQLKFPDNRLCTQCHQPGKYDAAVHHHHPVGSAGTSCVECHMPATTYMVVDPRRDHSLRIPRPDLTVALGTPNACNGCHTKPTESATWAAERVEEWFGPRRPDDPHWAPVLAAGRRGEPEGALALRQLVDRKATPAIVRATAIELLAQYQDDDEVSRRAVAKSLTDKQPLVRLAATRAYSPPTIDEFVRVLSKRLTDRRRTVRMAAASRLAAVSADQFSSPQYDALRQALKEYRSSQALALDRAAAHVNLGGLATRIAATQMPPPSYGSSPAGAQLPTSARRHLEYAVEQYRHAMRLESYLAGPRRELATLLEQLGGDPDEIAQLRREDRELLMRDSELLPDSAGVHYELGLSLFLEDRHEEAEAALLRACQLDPYSYQFRLTLALLQERRERWEAAVESIRVLDELRPNDRAAREILVRVLQARRRQEKE